MNDDIRVVSREMIFEIVRDGSHKRIDTGSRRAVILAADKDGVKWVEYMIEWNPGAASYAKSDLKDRYGIALHLNGKPGWFEDALDDLAEQEAAAVAREKRDWLFGPPCVIIQHVITDKLF